MERPSGGGPGQNRSYEVNGLFGAVARGQTVERTVYGMLRRIGEVRDESPMR